MSSTPGRHPGKRWKVRAILIFLLPILVLVVGPIGLLIWNYHIHRNGLKAWEETRAELLAEGLELDLSAFYSEEPPDPETNFGSAPLISSLWRVEPGTDPPVYLDPERAGSLLKMELPKFVGKKYPSFMIAERAALIRIAAELGYDTDHQIEAAQFFLQHFESSNATLTELRAEAEREQAIMWMPAPENSMALLQKPLTGYGEIVALQQFLVIHACAALETGDADAARSSLRIMIRLSDLMEYPPDMITRMVDLTLSMLALGVIWQSLDTEPLEVDLPSYLAWLNAKRAHLQPLFIRSLNVELLWGLESCQIMQIPAFSGSWAWRILQGKPGGLVEWNKASCGELHLEMATLPARRFDPHESVTEKEAILGKPNKRNLVAFPVVQSYDGLLQRVIQFATSLDLARVACAAEIYYLDHGEYPENGGDLVPDYLPEIPVDLYSASGTPLIYERTSDRYKAYSVYLDKVDGGGEIALRWRSTLQEMAWDKKAGDLVWGYDYPEEEAKALEGH